MQDKSTINQKIEQTLIIALDTTKAKQEIQQILENHQIGGVLLYKKNYTTYSDMIEFINFIKQTNQKAGNPPIFISIDQEGGRVNRIPPDFKNLPSAYALAQTQNEEIIKEAANITARILSNAGVNMNFAPVLDIKRFANNHAIGDRSYSENKEVVAKYGNIYMKEMQERNVLPVIKHFPGHGLTKKDTHFRLPTINSKIEEIEKEDMMPFKKLIENGADAMLVSHIIIKGFSKGYPASVSREVIKYIEDKLQFKGLIVTDDMRMKAMVMSYGKNNAVKKAVLAGNDMIVMKYSEKDRVYEKLEKLVSNNKIEESEIDRRVEKILKMKEKYQVKDEISKNELDIEKENFAIERIRGMCL